MSLTTVLDRVFDRISQLQRSNARITIGDVVDAAGKSSIVLMIFVVSIPTSIPAPPLGPEHMPFAVVQWILAAQLLVGRKQLWLPEFGRETTINTTSAAYANGVRVVRDVVQQFEGSPRRNALFGRVGEIVLSLLVFAMSFLMFLPVPFTNVLPSMTVTLTSMAFMLRNPNLLALAYAASAAVLFGYWRGLRWCVRWVARLAI